MSSISEKWERVRTTPGLGRDTLAIAGMVVAGIVGALLILGSLAKAGPFESRKEVKVEFAAINGMNPSSQPKVTTAGVVVGYVTDAETTDRGTALVTLNIEGGRPTYQNARAILRPKNPLNDMQIELNPGGPPAPELPDEGFIPAAQTDRPIQADEILGKLDERTQTAMTSLLSEADVALAKSSTQLPGGLGATSTTVSRLRPVVDNLATRRENIRQLVTALSQISQAAGKNDERLAHLVDSTQRTLGALAGNDDSLRASLDQLPGVGDEVRNALSGTQRLTKQLDPTLDNLGAASKELPPALDQLRNTAKQLDKTVDVLGPVVDEAKPVVKDLRPVVDDVHSALGDLKPVTGRLDRDTKIITSYLTELQAFIYNTRSVFGAGDAQGGIIRGYLVVPPSGFILPNGGGTAPGPDVNRALGGTSDPNATGKSKAQMPALPVPSPLVGGNR